MALPPFMRNRAITYDSGCHDLASSFLSDHPHLDTPKNAEELAALIQSTIEDHIAHLERNYEPPDPMRGVEFARNH